jgi:hypothetical protein
MGRLAVGTLFLVGLLFLINGCSDQGEPAITGNGTIAFSSLDGGCWFIDLDDSVYYEFRDLPEGFRHDGLRVRIAAKLSRSQISFCGSSNGVIDVIEIHRL